MPREAFHPGSPTEGPMSSSLNAKLAWVSLFLVILSVRATAQQASLRHYDVGDGLASSHVTCIFQDAKGYLWFGTWDGLSRFDGYQFVNYGSQDGLPHGAVDSVVQDPGGHLWVATNSGIARFEDQRVTPGADRESGQGSLAKARFTSFSLAQPGDSSENRKRRRSKPRLLRRPGQYVVRNQPRRLSRLWSAASWRASV